MPPALQNVGFEPQINTPMPLDLSFRDETGRAGQLRDYFGQRAVVLAFVYYGCPMLCNQVQQGVVGSLRMLSFNPGRDYEVVFVSFDSRETPDMAAQKKKAALAQFRRPETSSGWHFLTGSQASIEALTRAANFRFNFDPKTNLFAHASGVMLLSGRPHLALFLRRGIPGPRHAPRSRRCFRGKDRNAYRSCAALLLSVRSFCRHLQCFHPADCPSWRNSDSVDDCDGNYDFSPP
jgi:cytochrome oxidase Cu insertion factor (SCO1/SenC/PrrC family)